MHHLTLLEHYYRSWINKDVKGIIDVFVPGELAIRQYTEQTIYDADTLINVVLESNITTFEFKSHRIHNEVIYAELEMNMETPINMKAVIQQGRIERLYETVQTPLKRIKMICAYDGSVFQGFQVQPDSKTVQGEIEKGLKYLTNEEIIIHSSGRTDKGVHANYQVFHFDTNSQIEPTRFAKVLNNYVPDSIYLKESVEVDSTFHSRYDVKTKEYLYVINKQEYNPIQREYEWFVENINFDILKRELTSLIGTNDFTSYTKHVEDKEMVRTIFDITFDVTDTHIKIHFKGTGFLRYMIRYLVGTAVEIATNRLHTTMLELLDQKDASNVKWIAPGAGLYLNHVTHYE